MPTLIHQRVREAQTGHNKTVICQMKSGWAVFGDSQFIPSYCLLLADPVVDDLNALEGGKRNQFMQDMALIGDALLDTTDSFRINYEIMGNRDPALHAHIFPRYMSEPKKQRMYPIWMSYSSEERASRLFDLDRDKELMEKLAAYIKTNQ